jgi:hypothetical protein
MAAVFDGELMSYRWCNACCAAMAKSLYDDGEARKGRNPSTGDDIEFPAK